jgi:DNA-binding GntR family transcriptional regulator
LQLKRESAGEQIVKDLDLEIGADVFHLKRLRLSTPLM